LDVYWTMCGLQSWQSVCVLDTVWTTVASFGPPQAPALEVKRAVCHIWESLAHTYLRCSGSAPGGTQHTTRAGRFFWSYRTTFDWKRTAPRLTCHRCRSTRTRAETSDRHAACRHPPDPKPAIHLRLWQGFRCPRRPGRSHHRRPRRTWESRCTRSRTHRRSSPTSRGQGRGGGRVVCCRLSDAIFLGTVETAKR
jgi:hypothetical protein